MSEDSTKRDVEHTIEDGIAHIRLCRPERANALRPKSCVELKEIVRKLSHEKELGAIVVSGDGPVFCAGGDLKAFAAAERLDDFVYDMATDFHVVFDYLERIDAPTIAAVEGKVGGAGVSMVAALDLAVVSEESSFTLGYNAVGLTPDGSSSYYLTRAVGLKRAVDLALTNRTIDAATARDWGLVTRLAPAGEALEQAMALARLVAGRETTVLGQTRRLFAQGTERSLREAMARETESVTWAASRPAAKERMAAFLNRGKKRG